MLDRLALIAVVFMAFTNMGDWLFKIFGVLSYESYFAMYLICSFGLGRWAHSVWVRL